MISPVNSSATKVSLLNRIPLSAKTLAFCLIFGLSFWFASDYLQNTLLQNILFKQSKKNISIQAEAQRMRLDRYVKQYFLGAKLIATQANFQKYIGSITLLGWPNLLEENIEVIHHKTPPEWLPSRSLMRNFIKARYIILLDSKNRPREIYHKGDEHIINLFTESGNILFQSSLSQSFLTLHNEKPFIIASHKIYNDAKQLTASIVMATPLDDEFLFRAQGVTTGKTLVALTSGLPPYILASNDINLLPVGTAVDNLHERYIIVKNNFFDYGNSDLQCQVAVLFSKRLINQDIQTILASQRVYRTLASALFILLFTAGTYVVTVKIKKLARYVVNFEQNELNGPSMSVVYGDELYSLRYHFDHMVETIKHFRRVKIRDEEMLRFERDQVQYYLDIAGVLIAVIDHAGEITSINRKGCTLLGAREEDIIGKNWFDTFIPSEGIKEEDIFFQIFNKTIAGVEKSPLKSQIISLSGETKLIAWLNIDPLPESKQGSFLIACEDITERTNMEQKLRETHRMEAASTIAGGVAHHFNNYLAAILGFAELAKLDTPEGSSINEGMDEIINAVYGAKKIAKQLMVFSENEEEHFEPVKIDEIIQDALKVMRSSIPDTIDIKQSITPDLVIKGNSIQIYQILVDICTNASQNMETGGVLEVALRDMQPEDNCQELRSASKQVPYVKLSITDTGPGIDPSIIDRIFDPFFTTKQIGQGTGMGLSLVHASVKKHGGSITVDSTLGHGTTFNLFFPKVHKLKSPKVKELDNALHGRERILLIDDEKSLVSMSREILARLGYDVVTETDGLAALELFRSQPEIFDLVITDLMMPHITGEQLAIAMKHIRPDIPIILNTGAPSTLDKVRIKNAGINDIIEKPATTQQFVEKIRQVLDGSGAEGENSTIC